MKIVSVVALGDDAGLVDAHLAFHLNAGVDLVLAIDAGIGAATAEVLDVYERAHLLVRAETGDDGDLTTRLARLAVTEHGADWVLSCDADEFWWPRGESLKDVLAAIPLRYGVVQALVRVFPPRAGEEPFAERMTARPAFLEPSSRPEEVTAALRPVYRADPVLVVDPEDGTDGGRRVPLRAWYPIEVLRFPFRSPEQAARRCEAGAVPRSKLEADAIDAYRAGRLAGWYSESAADADLVSDERLRDALRALTTPERGDSPSGYSLPPPGGEGLALRPPTIVDDAAYAGECAAVGEVDVAAIDSHIRELESRIRALEERFWPRVLRRLSRLVRR